MVTAHDDTAAAPVEDVYLKPLAIPGAPAEGAVPLAGGPLFFRDCELLERTPSGVRRERLSAVQARARAPALFARLTDPRHPLAGLDWSRPAVMAVLNVTPDSFSDGGRFANAAEAVAAGRAMFADGADIVDVGGESTRPGATAVDLDEELARVAPVLAGLDEAGVPVSIDSRRAAVMAAAVEAGAAMLNDVSGLSHDPDSATVAAASGLPVVLMHSRGDPDTMSRHAHYDAVVLDVYDELEAAVARAEAAGVARRRIIVDPGIGFAKTATQSAAVLADLAVLHGLGCPLLVGVSRKSFIATIAGAAPADRRLPGSLSALLAARAAGAQMFRVHDVAETRQALALWEAIAGGGERGG